MPRQFGGAFEMWSPERLIIATVTKRTRGEAWLSVKSSRGEGYDEVSTIIEDTQERVIVAFRTGELTSYVHNIGTGLFYAIPARVWDADDAMGYLAGRLYRSPNDDAFQRSISATFIDTAITIEAAEAASWLRGRTVGSMTPTLPKPVPGNDLDKWFDNLTPGQLDLKNDDFVQLARENFPSNLVARDRVLDIRRRAVGHRDAGRPKTNGD